MAASDIEGLPIPRRFDPGDHGERSHRLRIGSEAVAPEGVRVLGRMADALSPVWPITAPQIPVIMGYVMLEPAE